MTEPLQPHYYKEIRIYRLHGKRGFGMGVVIYPPTIDWSYMKQRPQHIMTMFAKHGYPVIYFNKQNRAGPVVERVSSRLYVVNHAEYFLQHMLPKLRSMKKLYWASWSKTLSTAARFEADTIIYDCVDDFPDWEQDEQKWAGLADMVVCTADRLKQKMESLVPNKPIQIIRNGCDWEYFAGALKLHTPSLDQVPVSSGGKIGYVGAWAPWVDEQLLQYTAASLPDCQFIIVGPKLRDDVPDYGPNVFYLGYRDYSELPSLLSYLDVCIIPFRLNRITESTNPIKVYEYLAAGKPVVATNLPEVRKLQPYARTAGSPTQFVELIRESLAFSKEDRERLSQYARSFSWEQRYAQIQNMITKRDPLFLPPKAFAVLDAMASDPRTRAVQLSHCTVNSYYPHMNLMKDPPLVGHMSGAEYQCFLKPDAPLALRPYAKVFLEFEISGGIPEETDFDIRIASTGQFWERRTLTYANQPTCVTAAAIQPSNFVNETISIDVTSIAQANGRTSFRLSSSLPRPLRIAGARLTIFEK
jgi:glycosyltransferase involved in cell wall biosynthesis